MVVLTGDGGLNYCLGEMAVLHEQNMDVKVVVLNNSILGWIKWYEAAMWDGRFTEVDTETIDYAAVARGLNCKGISIRDPRDPSGRAEDGTGAGRASGHRHHHSGNGSM